MGAGAGDGAGLGVGAGGAATIKFVTCVELGCFIGGATTLVRSGAGEDCATGVAIGRGCGGSEGLIAFFDQNQPATPAISSRSNQGNSRRGRRWEVEDLD